jgi:hypothetical protein
MLCSSCKHGIRQPKVPAARWNCGSDMAAQVKKSARSQIIDRFNRGGIPQSFNTKTRLPQARHGCADICECAN